jgi:hypothetical protein
MNDKTWNEIWELRERLAKERSLNNKLWESNKELIQTIYNMQQVVEVYDNEHKIQRTRE